jgi:hypothetical protein
MNILFTIKNILRPLNDLSRVEKLFYFLLFFNVIIELIPRWQGSFVTKFMDIKDFMALSTRIARFANLIIIILILLNGKIKKSLKSAVIFLVFFSMILSKAFNFTVEEITQPIDFLLFNLAIFCALKLKPFDDNIFNLISIAFIAWSVAPVLYLPIAPASEQLMLFASDPDSSEIVSTFCGFSTHRNGYGYYCGIACILTIMSSYNKYLKVFFLTVMGIGLFLAASRSSILAVLCAYVYYYFKTSSIKQKLFFATLLLAVLYVGFQAAQVTESRILEEGGGRDDINASSYELFQESPIFGHGKTTLTKVANFEGLYAPPHNMIYSTLLDYGLMGLFCFFLYLFVLYRTSNEKARVFLLYICIIGVFQPCFGLYSPSNIQLIIYLLMAIFNARRIHLSSVPCEK